MMLRAAFRGDIGMMKYVLINCEPVASTEHVVDKIYNKDNPHEHATGLFKEPESDVFDLLVVFRSQIALKILLQVVLMAGLVFENKFYAVWDVDVRVMTARKANFQSSRMLSSSLMRNGFEENYHILNLLFVALIECIDEACDLAFS
ncbi:hypothetical protein K4K53_007784 [Colletotrichum sp. SAR 10_77]|nr:hypothetical protein K4K53_007784 [Colletotrichum sp. SAR 10_77]